MSLFTLGIDDQVKQIDHYEKKIFGQDPKSMVVSLSPSLPSEVVPPLYSISTADNGK